MPHLSGIQMAKIVKQKVQIIFTTAYPQFALESYEVNALDYLLKPFQFERFYEAALKLKGRQQQILPNSKNEVDHLYVKTDGKNNFERVSLKDICFIEASRNYIIIYLKDRRIITHSTLKHIESYLPNDQFIKVHKSYIVSLTHIERTDSQSIFINGKELPIGHTHRESFFDRIRQRKL
ncbi:MAG: DNA-binding LytR/AlgR family response regulator [Vicingaceae bacterium]|jgi:DNA-binding LytR/AlgR family response regulator